MLDKEESKKVFEFLKRKEGTLSLIDSVPKAYQEFKDSINTKIREEGSILRGKLFSDDITSAMYSGYKNALEGYLRSAEESNRFIIERACLSIFVSSTESKYVKLLKERKWHLLVDNGYIIRNSGEGIGRIIKTAGKKLKLNGYSVYLIGVPVCEKHLKFRDYSMSITELTNTLRVNIKSKCKFCYRQADYFTLAMPKVNALIGLTQEITGKNTGNLMNIYSNISRVIHPYGFTDIDKDKAFTLWARDFLYILTEINNLLGLPNNNNYV